MIGAPYIAARRHWDEGNKKANDESESRKTGDSQKASNDGKQEARAGERSVTEILRGDSRDLAKLRDAVE